MKKVILTSRKKTKEEKKYSRILTLFFMVSVAIILLFSVAVIFTILWIFIKTGVWTQEQLIGSKFFIVFAFVFTSVVVGIGIAMLLGRFILTPFTTLINGMVSLSHGEYSTRIHLGKYMGMAQISDGFNNMAQELENTELLRSDFINNFSHEFKTPIASIKTLIELLQKENLSAEKQKEYLAVIDEEVSRLLDMSTNVLNLSKIENQNILSNQESYNLSEQIRSCLLLLSKKWERKNMNLCLDLDEVQIHADADLMNHVWINLLDNAIKFSENEKDLKIHLTQANDCITVQIENTGVAIKPEEKEKIFQKFYQSDNTHTKEGNGIGLSIVKHIIDLHKGTIEADSHNGKTVFTVTLPMT